MSARSRRCPTCGNFDSLRPAKGDEATVTHEGRTFEVLQYVCVACALSDLVERNFRAVSENTVPQAPGSPTPADGRKFVAVALPSQAHETEVTR